MKTILKLAGLLTLMVGMAGFSSCNNGENNTPKTNGNSVGKPGTPTVVSVTNISATLSWTAAENAANYYVSYKKVSDADFGEPVNARRATTYTITGLAEETEYEWFVQAQDADKNKGEEAYGENFTTSAYVVPKPTGLDYTDLNPEGCILNWDAITDATHFNLEINGPIANGNQSWSAKLSAAQFPTGGNTNGLLKPSSSYTWRLQTVIDDKVSEWVNGPNITTPAAMTLPADYSGLVGNYVANGNHFFTTNPGPDTWNSSSAINYDIDAGTLLEQNGTRSVDFAVLFYNMFADDNGFIMNVLKINDNTLIFDDGSTTGEGTIDDIPVQVVAMAYRINETDGTFGLNWDENISSFAIALTWNKDTRTLTFPTTHNGNTLGFGFAGLSTDGSGKWWAVSEVYKNLVVTTSTPTGRAPMMSVIGEKVEGVKVHKFEKFSNKNFAPYSVSKRAATIASLR